MAEGRPMLKSSASQPNNPKLVPPQQQPPPDLYKTYSTFLHPTFDANQFANAIVNSEPYPPPSEAVGATPATPAATSTETGGFMKGFDSGSGIGDVSAALARLNFGVEDLNRQLKAEITKHHSSLLLQAASLGGLENDLGQVRRGLAEVEGGVTRLKRKINTPHQTLSSALLLLTRLRRTSSLARRAARFTVLAKRLEAQMKDMEEDGSADGLSVKSTALTTTAGGKEKRERAMAEAALTLAEIELLLTPPPEPSSDNPNSMPIEEDPEYLIPIRTLKAVEQNVPQVRVCRERVVQEMENMVGKGLDSLDAGLLSSALQTAHNLSVLPKLVESLMKGLTDFVSRRIKTVFDMPSLAREMNGKENSNSGGLTMNAAFVYKSRNRNEPTNVTMPQWNAAMWTRLESLVEDLEGVCIKVYSLEKVLKKKRDINSQQSFLDEAMTILDNPPSLLFWTTLSHALETQSRESTKSSNFIQTMFSTGYPRLLRLFQEFFEKISVSTDTVYTLREQSPETVLVLRSVQPFETLYLTRSTNRLNESISSSFSISSSLSASFSSRPPSVPSANEGLSAARAIVNELDAARFDPLLVKAVARGAARAIDMFVSRAESLISHDHSSVSLLGPLATPTQHNNADMASSLYHLWSPLHRAVPDHSESVREILKPAVEAVKTAYLSIANPLIMAIRREFSSIITKMHRVDYSKKLDQNSNAMMQNGASTYMVDLTEKLTFVREELLGVFRVGDLAKEWALDLARFTVQTYVLHASIVKSLGESGKLKLTSDTTALEFAISQYLSTHGLALSSMGDQFKALRAFRPLLFLDNAQLSSPSATADVPTLILLHHILSRSVLPLPHQIHKWSEAEYVRWLNEHGEDERIALVEKVLAAWEAGKGADSGRTPEEEREGEEFCGILRKVLESRNESLPLVFGPDSSSDAASLAAQLLMASGYPVTFDSWTFKCPTGTAPADVWQGSKLADPTFFKSARGGGCTAEFKMSGANYIYLSGVTQPSTGMYGCSLDGGTVTWHNGYSLIQNQNAILCNFPNVTAGTHVAMVQNDPNGVSDLWLSMGYFRTMDRDQSSYPINMATTYPQWPTVAAPTLTKSKSKGTSSATLQSDSDMTGTSTSLATSLSTSSTLITSITYSSSSSPLASSSAASAGAPLSQLLSATSQKSPTSAAPASASPTRTTILNPPSDDSWMRTVGIGVLVFVVVVIICLFAACAICSKSRKAKDESDDSDGKEVALANVAKRKRRMESREMEREREAVAWRKE